MKALIALRKSWEWTIQYSGQNPHRQTEMPIVRRTESIRIGIVTPWHDLCLH
jgi:hypothetical protein